MALDLVNHGLVFQLRAVRFEVYGLRGIGQQLNFATGVIVALLEGCQCSGSLTLETKGGADFRPIDFEGCASLWCESD